jgi:hypothetical protein
VEGKFDFHPLTYFQKRLGIGEDLSIFPAPSASEAGTLISLLRGLGTSFVVVLDDDRAGRDAAKKYRDQHLLSDSQVFTLAQLDSKLSGKTFEALFAQEVIVLANENGHPTKGEFSLLFQRLRLEGNYKVGMGTTTNRVKSILTKLDAAVRSTPMPNVPPAKARKGKKSPKKK